MNKVNPPLIALPSKGRKRPRFLKRWESPIEGYLFISLWLIGIAFLTVWPFFQSIYFSLTKYSLLASPKWIGLQNYKTIIMNDDLFRQSLKVTIYFVLFTVPLKMIFALFVAMLLNKNIKGISVYRTMIYFPSLIGTSMAVSILWKNIFGSDGLFNQLLAVFGIHGTSWLSNPATSLPTIGLLDVWQFGSSMVIFLAGLKQISKELYEASSIDGASKPRQFISITLPMISPVILFNMVMQTIGSFQTFTQAFIITKGGPMNSTYMYAMYLYQRAFGRFEMGYASALAWILLVIIGLFTMLIFASTRYWVHYEAETGGAK
ncbi:sugar ABC transporter permease [Paenibacillus filicis]|uniref:Sugar ABC transporter permease n=1 Tax=Paenibacillus gyeongsangnamensis TaxID=3388067 RepID=A0ABT4QDS2_9BACL|nr:sugar ABC transporter permease [Paenibacillus filicis]MCZ8515010.1 sugar ABC transporter permease [Paenibacillus filicis]